jgi:hypothetical protein
MAIGNQRSSKHAGRRLVVIAALASGLTTSAWAQQERPQDRGHMMMMGDGSQMADMSLIHMLLANGDSVKRTVTLRPDGVETLTESDDPAIATAIQTHVASMYGRVQHDRPIHQRDPLFQAIFEHASEISFADELTPAGIKVVETSGDPYVVKLIQAHAEVLNLFIKNGHAEAMKNHAVPAK